MAGRGERRGRPAEQRGRATWKAAGGWPGQSTRTAGGATRTADRAPRASEEKAPRRPVAAPPWPPLEEARAARAQPW